MSREDGFSTFIGFCTDSTTFGDILVPSNWLGSTALMVTLARSLQCDRACCKCRALEGRSLTLVGWSLTLACTCTLRGDPLMPQSTCFVEDGAGT